MDSEVFRSPEARPRVGELTVVLATFNGERFLRQQLQSLLDQRVHPGQLIVGDDGSTDATLEILQLFSLHAPFPVTVVEHNRLGFAENFLRTAATAITPWVAFCDQDDVWLPGKLEQAAKAIGDAPAETKLFVQGATLTDESLQPVGQQTLSRKRRKRTLRLANHGFWVWPGFCLTVRSELLRDIDFALRPALGQGGAGIAHDRWVCVLANALGSVDFLPGSQALYRRHTGSVMTSAEADARSQSGSPTVAAELNASAGHALAFARALDQAATQMVGEPAQRLVQAAECYRNLAAVQGNRACIYAAEGRIARGCAFARAARAGGYGRKGFFRWGKRALLRDLKVVLSSLFTEH